MKRERCRLGLLILIGGIFYYLLIRYTDFRIPCLFYSVTHLKCPGCGITRMIYECSLFHFKAAAQKNYFLFYTSPVILGLCVYEFFIKKEKGPDKVVNSIAIGYLIALIVWTVLRNIVHL